MNSARSHTDGVHSDATPTESYVVTDNGLAPLPRPIETAQTFAAKLREIGYREPIAQPRQQFICITLGCHAVSDRPGACEDCRQEIEAGEFDHKPIPWSTVLWCLAAVVAAIVALVFFAGPVVK